MAAVAHARPASPGADGRARRRCAATCATSLGLTRAAAGRPTRKRYLAGFLAGLAAGAAGRHRSCRRTRRSTPEHALWVNGAARRACSPALPPSATGRRRSPRPTRTPPIAGRDPVGLADRQRRGLRRAPRPSGSPTPAGRRACAAWTTADPAALPRTPTCSDHQHLRRRRRPRQRHRRSGSPRRARHAAPRRAPLRRARLRRLHYDDFCGHGRRLDAPPRRARRGPARRRASTANPTTRTAARRLARPGAHRAAHRGAEPARPPPIAGRRRARARHRRLRTSRPRARPLTGNRLLSLPGVGEGGPPVHLRHPATATSRRLRGRRRARRLARQLPRPRRRSGWPSPAWTRRRPRRARRRGRRAAARGAAAATSTSPRSRPDLLRFVADRTRDRASCETLLRPDNKGELAQWTWGRQAIDVIAELAVRAAAAGMGRRAEAAAAAAVLDLVQPAASTPTRCQLTVSVVRYETPAAAPARASCSTFLADARARRRGPGLRPAAAALPAAGRPRRRR